MKPRRRAKTAVRSEAARSGRLKRAETLLRESEEKFAKLFESSPAKIAIGTMAGKLVDVNRAYAQFFGFSRKEMVGKTIAELGIISEAELRRLLSLGSGPGAAMRDVEVLMRARDGRTLNVLMSADIITLGGAPHRVATLVDVTQNRGTEEDRKRLEGHLAQAQKMESVGRLAGGVAHDFNNILTAISGFAGFVLSDLAETDPRRADVKGILALTERAARLTKQLLAFGRKQILKPQILDLNVVVGETAKMLGRLIGEDIALETRFSPVPCQVKVDSGQIEQVLVNLAINARDAMPQGGRLTFDTAVETPDAAFWSRRPEMRRGPVVRLTVSDTGMGMTEAVRSRVYEPFFTTKSKGKGTGLGLSMVYGIIKQSGGDIEIDSAPGRGATFRIYLPHVDGAEAAAQDRRLEPETPALQGTESVLLVEDEESVRLLAARALGSNGYFVIQAADGPQALAALEMLGRPVDILVTDVVMPGMSGRELARSVAKKSLARRTLFISGYADDAIVAEGVLEPGLAFLSKPFTSEMLLSKVRDVLDGPANLARA